MFFQVELAVRTVNMKHASANVVDVQNEPRSNWGDD